MDNTCDNTLQEIDQELTDIFEQIQNKSNALPDEKRAEFMAECDVLYHNYLTEVDQILGKLDQYKIRVDQLPLFVKTTNEAFERATGLTRTDQAFLIFAAVLQTVRQSFINRYKKRLSDQEAAKSVKWHSEEHSDRGREYYATIEEMRSNPVPFDAIRKENDLRNSSENPHISGFNHRYTAIGHDPILGLIFGTANILTNTLTMTDGKFRLKSYHVHTGESAMWGEIKSVDKLFKKANTTSIFANIYRRITEEGKEGWKALGVALAKEIVHLMTDVRTQKSLPLPFVSLISPKLSQIMNYAEIDALTLNIIGKEAGLAALINYIIATIHGWCYNPETDGERDIYAIRTRKIIQYSGEMALYSSTIQIAVRMYLSDISSVKYFDFGGSLITLKNTWESPFEIAKIKGEYLIKNCSNYLRYITNESRDN